MHQRPPFGLAQTHWFESLVQFQSPGAGGAVQKPTKCIDIGAQFVKLVSMLTNSSSKALSMPRLLDLEQQDRFFPVVCRTHDTMRLARFPTLAFQYLLFPFRAHQQIARVDWHFLNLVRVNESGAHVKKDRLIIWIERINGLRLRNGEFNLGSESLDSLPPVHFRNNRNRIGPH